MKPIVERFDDISAIHQENPDYEHCIRVEFKDAFAQMPETDDDAVIDEWYASDSYEAMKTMFETEACVLVFGDLVPTDIEFDWRDEQELWLRYNIGESWPILQPVDRDRVVWLICVEIAKELQDLSLRELAEQVRGGVKPVFDDDESLNQLLYEYFVSEDEDAGFVVYIDYGETVEFDYGNEAIDWIHRHIDHLERRLQIK